MPSRKRRSDPAAPRQEIQADSANDDPLRTGGAEDTPLKFCRELLPLVSRTFALNILTLPPSLEPPVTVAYLLCRIADTVEDEVREDAAIRRSLLAELARIVNFYPPSSEADAEAERFSCAALAKLRASTPISEIRLVGGTRYVLQALAELAPHERNLIVICLQQMISGMGDIAMRIERRGVPGLRDTAEMLEYCDYVAGTVGLLVTRLFLLEVPALESSGEHLEARANSFGRVLQLTNILKDVRKDWERGDCWLPRNVLARHGVTPETLIQPSVRTGGVAAVDEFIALACEEAGRAFEYVILLPPEQKRLRLCCLWPLFTALLTLRKLQDNPRLFESSPVKIRRTTFLTLIGITRVVASNDTVLKLMFRALTAGLRQFAERSKSLP